MSPRRETVGEAVARRAAADRAATIAGRVDRPDQDTDQRSDDRGRARKAAPRESAPQESERPAEGSAERRRAAGRGTAGRDIAGRDIAGRDMAGRDTAGRDGAGRARAGQDAARQDTAERAGSDRAGAGRAGVARRAGGRDATEGTTDRRARGGTNGRTDGRGRRDAAPTGGRAGRGSAARSAQGGSTQGTSVRGTVARGTVAERAAERGIGPGPTDRAPGRPAPSPVHRRRRRVALLVGVLVLLAGLAVGVRVLLLDLGLFDVEDVQVTGTLDVPQADVLGAAAVVPGEPLATVDTAGIASRVAQLPGIGAVEVGRGWPHTVTVAVTERTAVAVVRTPDGPQPVDATGVVYPAPVAPGLPQLTFGAVSPEDPSTRAALDVIGALPEDLRAQVVTVDVGLGGGTPQVTLGLTENRQVRWGPAGEGERKASVLVALLTRPGRVYDVTSPDLPTVRS